MTLSYQMSMVQIWSYSLTNYQVNKRNHNHCQQFIMYFCQEFLKKPPSTPGYLPPSCPVKCCYKLSSCCPAPRLCQYSRQQTRNCFTLWSRLGTMVSRSQPWRHHCHISTCSDNSSHLTWQHGQNSAQAGECVKSWPAWNQDILYRNISTLVSQPEERRPPRSCW